MTAVAETAARFDDESGGDADADDPAIWVHPTRRADSVVLGTLKNGGLDVYDLSGRTLQRLRTPPAPGEELEAGRYNNVDIAHDVTLGGATQDLALVSDRGRDKLRVYTIDPAGAAAPGGGVLTRVDYPGSPLLFSGSVPAVETQKTGYGLAARPDAPDGSDQVLISRRHTTRLGLFRLVGTDEGVSNRRLATLDLPETFTLADGSRWRPCTDPGEDPQVEGMVVDRSGTVLWAAQEDVGVWRIPLRADDFGRPRLVEPIREFGREAEFDPAEEECVVTGPPVPDSGTRVSADVEGLTIAYGGDEQLLLVSSQGDSRFVLFAKGGGDIAYRATFRVATGAATDGVQNSDGAAVVTQPVGAGFPTGLLVVHDGSNSPVVVDDEGEERANTDFKYLRWGDVLTATGVS